MCITYACFQKLIFYLIICLHCFSAPWIGTSRWWFISIQGASTRCLGQNPWESQAFGPSQSSKLPLRSTKGEEEREQTETSIPREQCITTVLQHPLKVSLSIRDKVRDLRESTWLVQTSWLISRWQKLVRWILFWLITSRVSLSRTVLLWVPSTSAYSAETER